MTLAVLFCGQGTQHPQMLPWLAEDALVRETCAALGVADWRAALSDAGWALRNRHAQTLLTGLGLAAWRQLQPALPPAGAMAGYSVGELAAFAAAGVFSDATALRLARQRADLMDAADARVAGGSGLMSVSGARAVLPAVLARQPQVGVAIELADDAVVLGGPRDALTRAEAELTRLGATCKRLGVAMASHVAWLDEAAAGFAELLGRSPLQPPALPLFSNFSGGRVRRPDEARTVLAGQIARTVRWTDCLDAIRAQRTSCVLEVGPGSALAAGWRRRHPDVPARSVDEFRSVAAVRDWVHRNLR